MGLVGGPAIVIMDVVGTLRIPGVFRREGLKEIQNGFFHALCKLVGDLAHDGFDIVPAKVIGGESFDFFLIVLPHGGGHFASEFRAGQQSTPILAAKCPEIDVRKSSVISAPPFRASEFQERLFIGGAAIHQVGTETLIFPD